MFTYLIFAIEIQRKNGPCILYLNFKKQLDQWMPNKSFNYCDPFNGEEKEFLEDKIRQ